MIEIQETENEYCAYGIRIDKAFCFNPATDIVKVEGVDAPCCDHHRIELRDAALIEDGEIRDIEATLSDIDADFERDRLDDEMRAEDEDDSAG